MGDASAQYQHVSDFQLIQLFIQCVDRILCDVWPLSVDLGFLLGFQLHVDPAHALRQGDKVRPAALFL